MRYFEKNSACGSSYENLWRSMHEAAHTLVNNLFVASHEEPGDESLRNNACAAYAMIGICEAIIDRAPEQIREKAYEEASEALEPLDVEEKLVELGLSLGLDEDYVRRTVKERFDE